jgi:uncharacterized protein
MEKDYKLTTDLYIIPYEEKGSDFYIAYFPLQSLVFEINKDAANILGRLKEKPLQASDRATRNFLDSLEKLKVINSKNEKKPYVPIKKAPFPNTTILLLTDTCQLKCIYCYGKSKRRGTKLPLHVAKCAIDTITANVLSSNAGIMHVGYHGGGEPTMNWSVLTRSFNYARKVAHDNNLQLYSSICSNGIFSKERAEWILRNIRDVAFSMDGIPEIHNRHRPMRNGRESFDAVAATIDIFNKNNKPFNLRLTATEFSYRKLPESVIFLWKRFHPKIISIEPLYVCGRCATTGCKAPPLHDFLAVMSEVIELGRSLNINIQYSGNRLENLVSRFCGAQGSNFFITPGGLVTACLEVSDMDDDRADYLIYGKYDARENKFIFDNEKYQRLAISQVQTFITCKDCFAKWHCAGDCIAKVPDFVRITQFRNEYRCHLNKTLIRQTLIDNMNRKINTSGMPEMIPGKTLIT